MELLGWALVFTSWLNPFRLGSGEELDGARDPDLHGQLKTHSHWKEGK